MTLPPTQDPTQDPTQAPNDPNAGGQTFFTGSPESGGGFVVENTPPAKEQWVVSETIKKSETLKTPERAEAPKPQVKQPEPPLKEEDKLETISSIAKEPNVVNKTTPKVQVHPITNTTDKLTTIADHEEEEFIENVVNTAHEHK